jgi:hypothetical protein
VNSRARPTGTPIAAALAKAPAGPALRLTEDVPCPGPRFGKAEKYRTTLLAMHGDASFTVKDATQVYVIAKKIGVVITTRKERGQVRVWRIS